MKITKHLRTHITLVVVICFLVFSVILASLSVYYSFGLIKTESEGKLMNLVRTHAKNLDSDFVERRIIAENIRNYVEVTFDLNELKENPNYMNTYENEIEPFIYKIAEDYSMAWIYFSPYLDNEAHDVWFWDQDNDGIPERMPQTDLAYYEDETDKDWYFVPMREKRAIWTNPYPTTVLEDKSIYWISHAVPVYIDDVFIGVVGNDFYYNDFLKSFSELSVYGSGYGMLLNAEHELVIHPDYDSVVSFDEIGGGSYQWITELMDKNETGILEYTWEDGDEKVLAYSHLDNDWIIAITASKDVMYKTLTNQIRYMVVITSLGILIAAMVVHNIAVRLTRRLENVTGVISATGEGNYDAPIPERYLSDESEIGVLARAVEVMRRQQKDSFDEIQHYSQGLERLVEERTKELEHINSELEISLDELKITQKNLVESKKFEAINRFHIELAHRMNTPLGNVAMTVSYMSKLLEEIESDMYSKDSSRVKEELKSLKDSIGIATTGIQTSSEIIRGLQELSKDLEGAVADRVDIKEIVEVSYLEFRNRLIDKQAFQVDIKSPEMLKVDTYPILLMDVFNNLFKYSAMYSMKEKNEKEVFIEISQERESIVIEYRDESTLKYAEIKDHIFEPFSVSSFETGIGGMELHLVFNLVSIGLKGKIECLEGEKGKPYFVMKLPTSTL